jgi:hypothetical protein
MMQFVSFYLECFLGNERLIKRKEFGSQAKRYRSSGIMIKDVFDSCGNVNFECYCNQIKSAHPFNYSDVVELLGKETFDSIEKNRIKILYTPNAIYSPACSHISEMWLPHIYHAKMKLAEQYAQSKKTVFWIDVGLYSHHDGFTGDAFEYIKNKTFKSSVDGIHFVKAKWKTKNQYEGLRMQQYTKKHNIQFNPEFAVAGGIFGGDSINTLSKIYFEALNYFLEQGYVPTEEDILAYLLREGKIDNFHIHENIKDLFVHLTY